MRIDMQIALGLDVQVNNSGADTPESTTQSETSMAVLGNTICAGYNDSGTNRYSGLARSDDLGATWTDLGEIGQRGDPVIAVHEDSGTFYYAEIATLGGNPAIGVAVSTDDCMSFGAPVDASPVSSGLVATTLNDKPWIAVDNTGGANDGNVYVCWTRFATTGSELPPLYGCIADAMINTLSSERDVSSSRRSSPQPITEVDSPTRQVAH